MKHWIFVTILLFLIVTCSNNKPKLIPKKELIEMMVDLNIYDALSVDSYITSQLGGLDSTDIYSSFFAKHIYTKEDFQYTLQYYSNKPKKLSAVYDAVFAELSKKSDELKELAENFAYGSLQNIWNYRIQTPSMLDSMNQPDHYNIKIDSTGTYVITAQIKMKAVDQSINPRITAYFYNPENDVENQRHYFNNTKIIKSDYFREYIVYEKNSDSLLSHILIILPDRDNKDTLFNKSFELTSFTVGVMRNDPDKKVKNK